MWRLAVVAAAGAQEATDGAVRLAGRVSRARSLGSLESLGPEAETRMPVAWRQDVVVA